MNLKEISISADPRLTQQKAFNVETHCVQEMYYMRLRGLNFQNLAKVAIILVQQEDLELTSKLFGNVMQITTPFNFDLYFVKSEIERKRMVLNEIHAAMNSISDDSFKPLLKAAYDYCIDNNLNNRFRMHDQVYWSKTRQHYGAIDCAWEINVFQAFGVIFDKHGNEVKRELLVELPSYFGEFIYYAKGLWKDDRFILRSKEGKEWEMSLK